MQQRADILAHVYVSDNKIVIGMLFIIVRRAPGGSVEVYFPSGKRKRGREREMFSHLLCADLATCVDAPISTYKPISSFSPSASSSFVSRRLGFREVNALAGRKSIAQVCGRCDANPRGCRKRNEKGNVFILESSS